MTRSVALRPPSIESLAPEVLLLQCLLDGGAYDDAKVLISPELLTWADTVFVMERVHRSRLSAKFKRHLNGKRVICLDIPDDYDFMDPMLIRLLKQKVARFLPANVVTS